jgi:hypothetical protein
MMIRINFDEYGIYDVKGIVDNLESYFGFSYDDLINKFSTFYDDVIEIEKIKKYCYDNLSELNESRFNLEIGEGVIQKRVVDYNHFYKLLYIYKNKAMRLLYLLKYLSSDNHNKVYEEFLEKLDISHIGSVVCGRDLDRIMMALKNCVMKYDEYLYKINNFKTYNKQNVDGFSIEFGDIEYSDIYLLDRNNTGDKTNIKLTKKQRNLKLRRCGI